MSGSADAGSLRPGPKVTRPGSRAYVRPLPSRTVNGVSVLHAGAGRLDGGWHRQTSDEFLLVVEGELIVEFEAGPLAAGPGEAILIAAGERHRAAVPADCLLLSVEAAGMKRTDG